jgi:hypothetical protein
MTGGPARLVLAMPGNPFDVSAVGAKIVAVTTALRNQNYRYTLPLVSSYRPHVTSTPMGPIGIMINGAVLYNPYEANASTVATNDNFGHRPGRARVVPRLVRRPSRGAG